MTALPSPAAQPFQPSDRILAVQYLRGAAAVCVFLFHISAEVESRWGSNAVVVDQIGAAGVDLFFVISGFVMAMLVARDGPSGPLPFFGRRLLRVAPPYFLVTAAVFVIAAVVPGVFNNTSADPLQLLHSLLFFPMAEDGELISPLLMVGWTLNYEIAFYAVVAVTAGLLGDRRLIGTMLVLFSAVLAGAILQPENPVAKFYTNPILIEFAFGIFIWHLWEAGYGRNRFASVLIGGAALAILILQFEQDPQSARPILWGLPVAMLLFASLGLLTFRSRFLEAVGNWSYAFYLTHVFVVAGWIRIVIPGFAGYGFSLPWQAHYLGMTVCGLVLAWLFYRFVEKPMMNAGAAILSLRSRKSGAVPAENRVTGALFRAVRPARHR